MKIEEARASINHIPHPYNNITSFRHISTCTVLIQPKRLALANNRPITAATAI